MAYCKPGDVTLGSVTPPRDFDVEKVIDQTAADIDAVLGRFYQLPANLSEQDPEQKPYAVILKTLNRYLATGTAIIQFAGSRQDDSLNAYGLWYLNQARDVLRKIESGKIVFPLKRIETSSDEFAGPYIINRDRSSRVDAFYDNGPLIASHREQRPVTSWPQ